MTRRETGQILLTMFVDRYWPTLFSLLTGYVESKGVKLEEALEVYISKLINALEDLRTKVVNQVGVERRELLHELVTAMIDAYRALAKAMVLQQ